MENRLHYFFSVRCCSLFLLFLALSSKADEVEDESLDLYSPIYFGDSSVNVGESFKINCRISISTPTEWLKDGESIRTHNLRHGRDDHSYVVTENEIEGERDKTLSSLSVKHALLVHKGKYQCNKDYSNYFELNVNDNEKSTTASQFVYKNNSIFSNKQKPTNVSGGGGSRGTDQVYTDQSEDFNWGLSDPAPPVTIETFSKKRKPKVESEETDAKMTNANMAVERKKESMDFFELEESDEDTFRALITTSTPKIRHSKAYHKQNTELSTMPTNPVAMVTQPTKKPPKKAAQVVGHYDNTEHKLRSFVIRYPLTLSCNVTAPKFPELKWRKNGTDVGDVDSLRGRYKIIDEERKFIIEKTDAADAGIYECWVESLKQGATFNVYAAIAVRVPSNTGVVEGEKLTIPCTVVGTEPTITWQIGNKTINETTGRYVLKDDDNGIKNAIFSIENISMEDRGEYKCIGVSPASEFGNADPASDTSMVRIKGKLAALWPFIGICAEVVVLCAIILIYEKRRNKTELEESDTDPNTDQEKQKPPRN